MIGTPADGGEPLKPITCSATSAPKRRWKHFTENLVARKAGEQRRFEVNYPADYPDRKLAGKNYTYTRRSCWALRKRSCPSSTTNSRKTSATSKRSTSCAAKFGKAWRQSASSGTTRQFATPLLAKIVAAHDFPVPEALVEKQMDTRLERAVRSLQRKEWIRAR